MEQYGMELEVMIQFFYNVQHKKLLGTFHVSKILCPIFCLLQLGIMFPILTGKQR